MLRQEVRVATAMANLYTAFEISQLTRGDKTEKERDQIIITQFYSKSSPMIQATMDYHKGQIVSLQGLDIMDLIEDNISTLSATDSSPGYFRQLMPKDSMFFQRYFKMLPLEIEAKIGKVAMLVKEVMTSTNINTNPKDNTTQNFLPYVEKMVAKSNLNSAQK
uniref:Uncharacterized protein n=1 Tax=Romanomermis culicivorax TaxID=13658 RepID=A0A915JZ87_ROMCU